MLARELAAALRGGRGSQRLACQAVAGDEPLAAALRGGRGSQPSRRRRGGGTWIWRPPFGAAEDRNLTILLTGTPRSELAAALRGGRGSQPPLLLGLHPRGQLAAALRGGRGSQPQLLQVPGAERAAGGRPSGRPRIATRWPRSQGSATYPGGRPSGRPRIATAAQARSANRAPLAAALRGGRGSQRARTLLPGSRDRLAAALRGGRGSQLSSWSPGPPAPPAGGRPSGRPRIATPAR